MKKGIALVYLVAGLSSRFGGKVKQFAAVGPNGESFIECSLAQTLKADFSKVVFIVGKRTRDLFRNKFGNNYKGLPIDYVFQDFNEAKRDKPWGTADALSCATTLLDVPFVVCTGDDLYGEHSFTTLAEHLRIYKEEACIGHRLDKVLPSTGQVNRALFQTKKGYVTKIGDVFSVDPKKVSADAANRLCCMTIFALHPKILEEISLLVEDFKRTNINDRISELQLHTILSKLIEDGKIQMKLYPAQDPWIGLSNPEDENLVKKRLAKTSYSEDLNSLL